jgi:hypothetical protein
MIGRLQQLRCNAPRHIYYLRVPCRLASIMLVLIRESHQRQNPATRNRAMNHLIAAGVYSQMLYYLSYRRLSILVLPPCQSLLVVFLRINPSQLTFLPL